MSSRASLPSFQGERLRQARDIRQITATALAERIGVSSATVSFWEKGRVQPRPEALGDLSRVLELPEPFFLRALSANAPDVFRFRSMSSATKRARSAAQGRSQWLHEIAEFLEAEVDLPTPQVPRLDLPADPQELRPEDIEAAADATREAWAMRDGPIPNLTQLLETKGVIVCRLALNTADLDGLSAWGKSGRPYVVLNSEKASCVRSRFDAAHELGHLVLHRNASARPDSALHKLLERQAHHFAGAFIFPRTAVRDEVPYADLDALVRIKERWKLSVGAMVFRLLQLGLIDAARKDRLQRQLGSRGWRTWEPLDDQLAAERPQLAQKAYQLLVMDGGWTPADIKRAVPIEDHDHELIAGLPSGWMRGRPQPAGELVRLKPSLSTEQRPITVGGTVIRFPETRRDVE